MDNNKKTPDIIIEGITRIEYYKKDIQNGDNGVSMFDLLSED